jgi:hypothetical protein
MKSSCESQPAETPPRVVDELGLSRPLIVAGVRKGAARVRQGASPTGAEKHRRPGRKAIAVTVEGCPETAEGEWKLLDG